MIRELRQGAFSEYQQLSAPIQYIPDDLPEGDAFQWATYTITADNPEISYRSIFYALDDLRGGQTIAAPTSNTAAGVPVTANSYRQPKTFSLRTGINFNQVDGRARADAVIQSLELVAPRTSFTVTLPTGRLVVVKFLNIDYVFPYDYGMVDITIEAQEYNPFPIQVETSVNGQGLPVTEDGDQTTDVRGPSQSVTATPRVM